ncbi:hypothetical protein GOP47_0019495 [Adiantum capillus-veneris]|uniref:X8 domain-containing protein n=1 Tax=Adiantum capillus-veneris TaxID=13818 RepID=A0A9D4UBM6_ADICA|nr:hypothetical protein GOP47_0019495 [Adiantum capillus-veneris]
MISGRPRLMGRLGNSWSILHALTLFFLCLHHSTGCYARMWRMMSEESEEVAEVVHLPSSFFHYRRQLQTGLYCQANPDADTTQLQTALDWACGSGTGLGNVDCSPLQVGGSCYNPNNIVAHATYAFNEYYVSQNGAAGSCSFNGLAAPTSTNPSASSTCVFQALGSGSGSGSNITVSPPPPSTSTPGSTTPSNNTGTIFTPPTGDNTTIGSTNSAPPPSITLPWLYALCGGILLIALSSKQ